MKKLLLLTTGGTIASVEGENGLAPGLKRKSFSTIYLMTILIIR